MCADRMCEAGQQVVYRQDVCSRSAGGVQTGGVYQVDRWCADRMCVAGQQVGVQTGCVYAGQQVVYRQDMCSWSAGGIHTGCG